MTSTDRTAPPAAELDGGIQHPLTAVVEKPRTALERRRVRDHFVESPA
ncbi:hypothetical protein [Streptomyces sp. AJS327]|nr:hypothetical protein [Streptomyces sp. AJS327]